MINVSSEKKPFDLEERLARLGEESIDLVKSVRITAVNKRIVEQLVGSSGSSGANYCEANQAESRKDFIHKIRIVRKELNETKHWLRLFAKSNPEKADDIRDCWKECNELLLIFAKINRTAQKNKFKN